jgi:hypothetical protein
MGKEQECPIHYGKTEAHHVSICPQEDRGSTAGEVGEVESRKEGCLEGRLVPNAPPLQ